MRYGVLLALLLCGCSSAKTIPLPGGKTGYVIENCREADCYRRAAKVCRGQYELVNASHSATGFVSGGMGLVAPRVSLVVKCT